MPFSWVSAGAAVIGAVSTLNQSDKAGEQSHQASQSVEKSNAVNEKLAQISQQEWDLYNRDAVPMLRELTARRTTPDRTGEEVSRAAGDVKDQYAAARANTMRALSFARNPADPGYADVLARSYGDEAGAVSRAMTEARRAERARVEDTNWNRTLQAIQGYQRLPQDVAANLQASSAGFRGAGALNADMAGMHSRNAAQAAYGGMYALSDAARRWNSSPPADVPVGSGYGPALSGRGAFDDELSYNPPADSGYQPGMAVPTYLDAADGGAIRRRGRSAVRPRPPRGRTFQHPYTMRYDDGGFVDQPSLDFIRNGRIRAAYDLTDDQKASLTGTAYANAPAYVQQEAIASRMLSGDQKFAPQTEQQRSFLNMLQQFKQTGDAGYVHRDWVYDSSWEDHLANAAGKAPTMPGTGQMDSDWARAEAERLYLGGQGAVTADFRARPKPAVAAAAPETAVDPYDSTLSGGMDNGSAAGDAGDGGAGDGGGGDGGGGDGGAAEGGYIRGPGTGTSDSIKGNVRPGSYILSADTTRALGMAKVHKMFEAAGIRPGMGGHDNNGVPVRLSNGEVQVPPEVVRHHGEEFFNKLQQKYHRPVREDEMSMANGGAIRRRMLPRVVEDAIYRSIPSRAIGRRG